MQGGGGDRVLSLVVMDVEQLRMGDPESSILSSVEPGGNSAPY